MDMQKVFFHKRPMYGAAAGALLGVLCGTALRSIWLALSITALCIVLGIRLFPRRRGFGLLLITGGLLLFRTVWVPLPHVAEGTYTVYGTIAETPDIGKTRTTLILRNVTLEETAFPARFQLSVPNGDYRYGDTIQTVASVSPVNALSRYADSRILAKGSAKETPVRLAHRDDAYGALLRLRQMFANGLDGLYGDRAPAAKGMLLGDRSDLTYSETQQYAESGIMHIFAVSGMHMTVLMTVFGSLIRTRRRWLHLLLITGLALFYCALTSFTPSVLRAAAFLIALQMTRNADRQEDAPSAYCLSAAVVLLIRPFSLYTVSFQFSFGSMAGILLLTQPITNVLHLPDSQLSRTLIGTIGAMLGVLPLQILYFGKLQWMAIVMSIPIMPALMVLMPLAFLSMFLAPVLPFLAKGLSIIPYGGLVYIDRLTSWIQGMPITIKQPNLFCMFFYYAGLVFCSQLYLRNRKNLPYIGMTCLLISVALWAFLP